MLCANRNLIHSIKQTRFLLLLQPARLYWFAKKRKSWRKCTIRKKTESIYKEDQLFPMCSFCSLITVQFFHFRSYKQCPFCFGRHSLKRRQPTLASWPLPAPKYSCRPNCLVRSRCPRFECMVTNLLPFYSVFVTRVTLANQVMFLHRAKANAKWYWEQTSLFHLLYCHLTAIGPLVNVNSLAKIR